MARPTGGLATRRDSLPARAARRTPRASYARRGDLDGVGRAARLGVSSSHSLTGTCAGTGSSVLQRQSRRPPNPESNPMRQMRPPLALLFFVVAAPAMAQEPSPSP